MKPSYPKQKSALFEINLKKLHQCIYFIYNFSFIHVSVNICEEFLIILFVLVLKHFVLLL